jgi:uncharacterized protein YegJ (DUF2314 family)
VAPGGRQRAQPGKPDSFDIPPAERRQQLARGEVVKLAFEGVQGGERMWVEMTDADHPQFAGVLESSPVCITGLAPGSLIRFDARHIIDIYEPDTA